MAVSQDSRAIVMALLDAGADVNARSKYDNTPLHDVATSELSAYVTALLEAGADIKARNTRGDTPLHLAAFDGTPDKVLALLDAGADGGAKNDDNETPFDHAKENKKLKGTDAYWRLNDARFD
jgi:ankyrin repeat protein